VGCGDLFFRLFAGKLICHQAADGKEVGSLELKGEFYASPIVWDGVLLLLDRDGTMTAVKAGPALEKIGTRAVGKSANASPAMAGGRLFVRTDKALVCIDTRTPPEERAAIPTAGLTVTKALAGKVDVTKALAAKVKDNRLVIVATSAFLGVDAGNDRIVVEYVLNGKKQTIELSAIAGDELGVATRGADWVKGVAVLGASKPLPAKGLGIKLAIYGKRDGWVDVTEKCNAAITNNKMTIVASDQLAGDPSSGPGKFILVSYVLDGKEGTTSCEQGEELTISADTLTAQQAWDALPPLKATFSRKIETRNTDLNRFIPVDGNTVYNAAGLLRTWPQSGPRELWRLKTGPSIGATVESGGRAFATGQLDGKQWAYCLEAKTGKIIWKTELGPEFMLPAHWWGTVATPVVDGDRVYFIPFHRLGDFHIQGGEECSLVCLRVSDGKELWRSGGDIPYVNGFSTPLVVGGTLFVLPQREKDVLVALDKISGKVLWTGKERTPKAGGAPYAGASPTYLELDGQGQLIYGLGNGEIIGVSVKDGSILWTIDRRMGHGLMASAVAVSNRVFLCSGENRFSMCIELKKREGQYVTKIVYESSSNQQNFFHTPSIHDGAVYGFSTSRLQCTSLDSGELLWEQREPRDWDTRQQLIVADGLIFGLTKGKELVMAEANKAGYKELGRVRHGLEIHHTQQPTLANGRLYIRGLDTVVCYQLTEALLESTPDVGSSVKPQ
jgi:outer membrane protein assembly factor BamB